MHNVRVKKRYDRTIISHKLKKHEQISAMEIDIINRREIPGLLPVRMVEGFWSSSLSFEVKDMMDIRTYLQSGISLHAFFDAVKQITDIFLKCQAHGIRTQNIELDYGCVFYRYSSRKVQMIYWPVISPSEAEDEREFFCSLGEMYVASARSQRWRKRYLDLFHSRERFDVCTLQREVDALLQEKEEMSRNRSVHDTGTTVLSVPYLVEEKSKRLIELNRFPFVIGRRSSTCDYVIQGNGYIGREHISLYQQDGRIFLHDCGSANGTTVNHKKIKPAQDVALETGSVIVLSGMETYVFYAAGAIANMGEKKQ